MNKSKGEEKVILDEIELKEVEVFGEENTPISIGGVACGFAICAGAACGGGCGGAFCFF